MGDEIQWLHFYQHTGGLNTRYSATSTPIFDATQMRNIENIVLGGFRKTSGYSRYVQAPILASGTYMRGTLLPSAESDAWTGAGDATTFSTSAGIMTSDESAGATGFQKWHNLEAGFTTGVDATAETRMKIRSGGTASGIYSYSILALDDGTKHFELGAVTVSGVAQIGILTTTAARTVAGSYSSLTDNDWTAYHRYRVVFDASDNVSVYVDDMTTAALTIAYSSLPASTETSRVTFGSYDTATVNIIDTDYVVYKIGATSLATDAITGIYAFVDEANTQDVIVTAGTKLYKYLSTTADWSEITGGTAFTSGAKPHFVTFNDASVSNAAIVIITTESRNKPQKWDGATRADLGGTPPSGRYCAVYNERLFIANTAAEPSAVYYSALGDPEDRDDQSGTWDQTNDVFLIDRHKHGEITGLATVNDVLLIFSKRAVHRLQGWGKGSFRLEEITTINGCVAPNSIIVGPFGDKRREGVFFRDREGYYWTDGDIGNVIRVSEKILTEISENFSAGSVENEAAFIDKSRSLVGWGTTQGSDTTNSIVYALDYIEGARPQQEMAGAYAEGWFPSTIPLRAAGTILDSGKDKVLFSDHTGLVFYMNSGNDADGADIDGYRTTAWLPMGAPQMEKLVRYIIVYGKAVGDWNMTLSWGINYQDDFTNQALVNLAGSSALLGTTFILGQSALGTTGLLFKKVTIDARGNAIRFRFQTTAKDEPFTILGFSVGFEMAEDWFESNV